MLLSEVCVAARRPLGALGALSHPLLAVNDQLNRLAGDRPADCLNDPTLPLDLLTRADPAPDPQVVGRLLDFLRQQAGQAAPTASGGLTVAEALAEYRAGPFQMLSGQTHRTYNHWYGRLLDSLGDRPIRPLLPGDLSAFIQQWMPEPDVQAVLPEGAGFGAANNGISALRALWTYCDEQGYADGRVAQKVKKPRMPRTRRRALTWHEQALLRHLAAHSGGYVVDPLMALLAVLLHQRVLMRMSEVVSVPISGVNLADRTITFRAKRGRKQTRPFGPAMAAFLRLYIESRRPRGMDAVSWSRSNEPLFRSAPSAKHPNGRAGGENGYKSLIVSLRLLAPDVFNGEVVMHSFRYSAATWIRQNYSEIVAQTALGHEPDNPSAVYMRASERELREAIEAYEVWCDTMPPPEPLPATSSAQEPAALATFVPSFRPPTVMESIPPRGAVPAA